MYNDNEIRVSICVNGCITPEGLNKCPRCAADIRQTITVPLPDGFIGIPFMYAENSAVVKNARSAYFRSNEDARRYQINMVAERHTREIECHQQLIRNIERQRDEEISRLFEL